MGSILGVTTGVFGGSTFGVTTGGFTIGFGSTFGTKGCFGSIFGGSIFAPGVPGLVFARSGFGGGAFFSSVTCARATAAFGTSSLMLLGCTATAG